MISTVASVAVRCVNSQVTEVAVVYDSEYNLFLNPSEFKLLPHHELIAVDRNASKFLEERNLFGNIMYKHSFLKYPCWECQNVKCLITIAFLAWRTSLKRKKGVPFCHGIQNVILKSPRTQELFISIDFDDNKCPINGCVVADNGYVEGKPNEWLPIVKESKIVITALGLKTGEWLKKQINYPIKIIHDINLKYPCNECDKKSCPLVKAYYGWKWQAFQTSYINH